MVEELVESCDQYRFMSHHTYNFYVQLKELFDIFGNLFIPHFVYS